MVLSDKWRENGWTLLWLPQMLIWLNCLVPRPPRLRQCYCALYWGNLASAKMDIGNINFEEGLTTVAWSSFSVKFSFIVQKLHAELRVSYLVFTFSDVVLDFLHFLRRVCCRHVVAFVQHFQSEHNEEENWDPSSDVLGDELDEDHSEDRREDCHESESGDCAGKYC